MEDVPKVFLEDVIPVTDSFIIDIKDMDPRIYSNYTGRDNKLVIDNLRMLSVNGLAPKCIIRIPEIPGFNDQDALLESERKVRSLGFENIDRFNYDTEYGKRKRNMQDA